MFKNKKMQRYLTHEEKIEVAKYLSQFHTPKQASYFIKEKFGLDISEFCVNKAFLREGKKWEGIINQFKAEYVSATMEVPISHKRVRLERYEWLYEEAVKSGKFPAAKACLDSAREETESGKIPSIGNLVFTQINNMSDEELHSEKDRLLEKLEKLGHKPRTEVIDAV